MVEPCLAIDLDNTIISYDEAFVRAAAALGLMGGQSFTDKQAVRDAIWQLRDGDVIWQELQALVYGELIHDAPSFEGVREFIERARSLGIDVAIVSHKTEFAGRSPAGPNLRTAARQWLHRNRLVGRGLVQDSNVFFESTRTAKLERIRALGAQIMIDDLIEVLTDPDVPPRVRRWLFAPHADNTFKGGDGLERFASWSQMSAALAE